MNRLPTARPDGGDDESRLLARRLEEVFSRYQDELLGMLYYVVGNAEDARDALQDAFIKCWKHRDGIAEVENVRAWLFRIALNAGRDMRGTAWHRRRQPLEEGGTTLAAATLRPDVEAVRNERLLIARQAISQLRPEEQEVFLLRQDGQMTYEQIAEAISIPLGTVKTRMRLSLMKLRQAMEGK
ncbi:MAG: RNA polymerase sigma factor [Thermoguttaceae bacterium]|jgi:RNA polymerase sigma-70 factor (ECF subfamily)